MVETDFVTTFSLHMFYGSDNAEEVLSHPTN